MDIRKLIDLASAECGSKAALSRAMDKAAPRISEWYRGDRKPDAHEIARMAMLAKLPVLETVAEIEAQMDERYAEIWRAALGKLRAAGVAAAYTFLVLQTAGGSEKAYANQTLTTKNSSPIEAAKIYIVETYGSSHSVGVMPGYGTKVTEISNF